MRFDRWTQGLPWDSFLKQKAQGQEEERWQNRLSQIVVPESVTARLQRMNRILRLRILASTWCGDCWEHCPILEAFSRVNPQIETRYLDRDMNEEVQSELKINGGMRVPVVVAFSEDGHEVARYGERPHASYERLMIQAGLLPGVPLRSSSEHQLALVHDWLREVERWQWILRLSPRLRRLHGH